MQPNQQYLPTKHAIIQEAEAGENVVVAAVPGRRIRVIAYNFMSNGAVNVKWQSGRPTSAGSPI